MLQSGLALARRHAEHDPVVGIQTLDIFTTLAAENEEAQALRRELLERIAKADPKNTEYVVALAELVEQDGDLDRCRKLLEPVQSELRHTEGARILGQILAGEGRLN